MDTECNLRLILILLTAASVILHVCELARVRRVEKRFQRKRGKIRTAPLKRMTQEELCETYRKLLQWEWPDALGKPPKGWADLPCVSKDAQERTKLTEASPYLSYIRERVPAKELWKR